MSASAVPTSSSPSPSGGAAVSASRGRPPRQPGTGETRQKKNGGGDGEHGRQQQHTRHSKQRNVPPGFPSSTSTTSVVVESTATEEDRVYVSGQEGGLVATNKQQQIRRHKQPARGSAQLSVVEPVVIATDDDNDSMLQQEDDPTRCLLCCERMDFCGLGECGHRVTCGLCTFRLRLLHHDEKCVLCKSKLERVYILKRLDPRTYGELYASTWGKVGSGLVLDAQSSIFYTSPDALPFKQQMDALREAACGECPQKFPNRQLMERHLKEVHSKQLCQLCVEFRGLFLKEQKRMTSGELDRHCRQGDGSKAFEGHPPCKFCQGSMYYNMDHLYLHLRDKHENCPLCSLQLQSQYYRDYQDLEVHFRTEHYMCEDPRCRESRGCAFPTKLQLQGHIANEHPELADGNRPLELDFVVRGSKRDTAGRTTEDAFLSAPARTPSPGLHLEDFPSLHGASTRSHVPTRSVGRYSQTATRGTSSTSASTGLLFGSLYILAYDGAAEDLKDACTRLKTGAMSAMDFYREVEQRLGQTALAAVYPEIQRFLGPELARQVDVVRTRGTRLVPTTLTSARWVPPPPPPSISTTSSARLESANFPSLERTGPTLKQVREERRAEAFAPKQARKVGWDAPQPVSSAKRDEFDEKLDVGGKKKPQQSQKKSQKDLVRSMAQGKD